MISGISFQCANLGAGVYIEQPRRAAIEHLSIDHSATPGSGYNGASGGFSLVQLTSTAAAYNEIRDISVAYAATDSFSDTLIDNGVREDFYSLNPGRDHYVISGSCKYSKPHLANGGRYGFTVTIGNSSVYIDAADAEGSTTLPPKSWIYIEANAGGLPLFVSNSYVGNSPSSGVAQGDGSIIQSESTTNTINAVFSNCTFIANANTAGWVYLPSNISGSIQIGNSIFEGSVTGTPITGTSALRIFGCKGFNPQGFAATTPAVPASGTAVANPNPYPVRLLILTATGATATYTDPSGTVSPSVALTAGQWVTLDPGESITPTYTTLTWKPYGV